MFGFPAIGLCRRFLWPADKGWLGWSNSLRKPAKIWANHMGTNYEGNISERKSINKSPDFPIKLYCKMSGDLHAMITLHHYMVDFLLSEEQLPCWRLNELSKHLILQVPVEFQFQPSSSWPFTNIEQHLASNTSVESCFGVCSWKVPTPPGQRKWLLWNMWKEQVFGTSMEARSMMIKRFELCGVDVCVLLVLSTHMRHLRNNGLENSVCLKHAKPPSLSVSIKVHGSSCGFKLKPWNQNPYLQTFFHDFQHQKKTKPNCFVVFGNPLSCGQTAAWHLGSVTTISGDITCKDEIGVVGSATTNNNIHPTGNFWVYRNYCRL